jgi:hypothetical protein
MMMVQMRDMGTMSNGCSTWVAFVGARGAGGAGVVGIRRVDGSQNQHRKSGWQPAAKRSAVSKCVAYTALVPSGLGAGGWYEDGTQEQ